MFFKTLSFQDSMMKWIVNEMKKGMRMALRVEFEQMREVSLLLRSVIKTVRDLAGNSSIS